MKLPIVAYGSPVLKLVGQDITPDYPGLAELIENMWETMYNANGVGLAAPQIGKAIRLFVIDSQQLLDSREDDDEENHLLKDGVKKVFINARITKLEGADFAYNEGCLSIPNIREDVSRHEIVTLEYQDENFVTHTETFNGITARVILHEYDHIEGKLFIDYLKPLRKKLLQGKLNDISKGKARIDYKMIFIK